MEIICEFYESYSREELWFDDKINQFSLRLNCWGAVDDEEHCVGTQETDAFNALKMLISYNYLDIVLQYSSQLQVAQNLDAVLSAMTPRTELRMDGYLADELCMYYKISEKEYAVYYENTFFSVTGQGKGIADFTVVRRILENRETVKRSQYNYFREEWTHFPL